MSDLKEIEKAIKEKIAEIETTPDPGERLLQYKALKQSCEGSYDREEAENNKTNRSYDVTDGAFAGAFVGVFPSIGAGTAVLLTVATAGIAIPLGLGIMAGGIGVSALAGRKLGGRKYNDEKKQAIRIYNLNTEIDKAIEVLTSTSTQNMEALSQSPHFEEVKKEFPDVAEEFSIHAKRMAEREKLLGKNVPAAKPGPKF